MLNINAEQFSKFSEVSVSNFESRMLSHIKLHFPQHYDELEKDNTIDLIRLGVENSKQYDILAECDVSKYINLMLSFGVDFDTNNELTWSRDILDDPTQNHGPSIINALYDAAMASLDEKKAQGARE